jgi:AcrR family transcriptional regulator
MNTKITSKDSLLDAALFLAEKFGYQRVTREQIALHADVATGTVTNYLGTMKQLRRTLVRHAVRTGNRRVIAQAVVAQDPYVMRRLTVNERIDVLRSVA